MHDGPFLRGCPSGERAEAADEGGFGARGLACEFEAPEEAFMALELAPGALAGASGLVRYEPEFDAAL